MMEAKESQKEPSLWFSRGRCSNAHEGLLSERKKRQSGESEQGSAPATRHPVETKNDWRREPRLGSPNLQIRNPTGSEIQNSEHLFRVQKFGFRIWDFKTRDTQLVKFMQVIQKKSKKE